MYMQIFTIVIKAGCLVNKPFVVELFPLVVVYYLLYPGLERKLKQPGFL
jgi:hypothetical protein